MIRHRLTLAVVALVAVALAVAGFGVLRILERRLLVTVDTELTARLGEVERVRRGPRGPDPRPVDGRSPFEVRDTLFVVLDPSGNPVVAIPTGPASNPDPVPEVTGLPADGRARTVRADGVRYRVMVVPTVDGGSLAVGLPLRSVDATLAETTRLLGAAGLLTVGTVAVAAWWVIRRGLRPIDEMIGVAGRIGSGQITERIPTTDAGGEVDRLASALNAMLDRLARALRDREASEQRLRRFAADASHELRTPLTSIRGYAELCRTGGDAVDVPAALARIEHEAIRMTALVEDLLLLARLDRGRTPHREPVPVADVVDEAVAAARAASPDHRFEPGPVTSGVVLADRDHLRRILDNLLANVHEHTPPGTTATVSAVTGDDEVVITVADDGPGMEAEGVTHAFERFWQADGDGGGGGTGLGLAIVAELAAANGGSASLESHPGTGTRVVVRLPRAPSTPAGSPTP